MIGWRGDQEREDPPILDEAFLERLASHIGRDETVELLADGMLELSDRLQRLDTLSAADDPEALQHLVHDIAGAAGHMGLSALSWHAAEANRALRAGGKHTKAAMSALIACRDRSIDALSRYCRAPGGKDPE